MSGTADGDSALDRREFLKRFVVGGIGVAVLPFPALGAELFAWPSQRNDAAGGLPLGRIDGYPKVTGQKLYSADFRAADISGGAAVRSVSVRRVTARKKLPGKAAEIGTPGIVPGFRAHPKRRRHRYTAISVA